MRLNRVLRFTILCLLAGAFVGLISGLAFGGAGKTPTIKVADSAGASPQATTTTAPLVGQPMTPDRAKLIGANEMGLVLVIAYNNISADSTDASTLTPDQFRDNLALLDSEGFYPINIRDLVAGDIDIPSGKSPVAITFDGSSPGQYRILEDGTIDPGCAVGVMQGLIEAGYWHPKATFLCLLDVVPSENEVFGQPERQKEKLRNLVDWGYEVGSNTMTNLDLSAATEDSIRNELANSQADLNSIIGNDYAVSSLALPKGNLPQSASVIASGTWQDLTYKYTAALGLESTPCASPFSTNFQPFHIPRIVSAGANLSVAIDDLKNHPQLMYISDGDPTTISAPYDLDSALGQLSNDPGRPVVRYQ
jgi:hypothetical protein